MDINATVGLANIRPNAPLPDARTDEDAYYATHDLDLHLPRWLVRLAATIVTAFRQPAAPLAVRRAT